MGICRWRHRENRFEEPAPDAPAGAWALLGPGRLACPAMAGRDEQGSGPGSAAVSTFASLKVPTFRLTWVGGFLYPLRRGHRRPFPQAPVLVLSTSLLTVSGAFLAVAILTDVISFWMLMVASAVEAVAFSLCRPAWPSR